MDHGSELVVREEAVENLCARCLAARRAAGNAGSQNLEARRWHSQGVGDGARGVHRERGPSHHRPVELHGHDHQSAVSCGEVRVEGKALHDRRAVDDRYVVIARSVVEREFEPLLPKHQLVLVDEVDERRHHAQVRNLGFMSHLLYGGVSVEKRYGVASGGLGFAVEPEVIGRRRLGVEVYQQDPLAVLGEQRSQVDGSGRLADAPFVVRDGDGVHRFLLCIRALAAQDVEGAQPGVS